MAAIDSEIESIRKAPQLKDECFRRDGWKCVVTGIYDASAASTMDIPDDALTEDTERGHIIPFAFGSFSERDVRIYPPFPKQGIIVDLHFF